MSRRTKISKLRNAKRRLKSQVSDLQNKVNDLQEQRDTLTCHDVGGFRSWGLFQCSVCSSLVIPKAIHYDSRINDIGNFANRYCPSCGSVIVSASSEEDDA